MHFTQKIQRVAVLLTILGLLAYTFSCNNAVATSVNNVSPKTKISFTFDDGLASTLDKAAPILSKYGFAATSYIITGCVSSSGSCPADKSARYMTWEQIARLQNQYGWEIGSHTVHHPYLSQVPASTQEYELSASKQALAEHGIKTNGFAAPYGDYNNKILAIAAKYYESQRGFWDSGLNQWPYNDSLLSVKQVQYGVDIATVEQDIDTAAKYNKWLILVFHDIKDTPSSNPDDYEYSSEGLDKIASYAKQHDLQATTINKGIITSNVNLLGNGSFEKKTW